MTTASVQVPGFVSQRLFQQAENLFKSMKIKECEDKGFVDPISQKMRMLGRAASTYAETMVQARFMECDDLILENMGDSSQSGNDLLLTETNSLRTYRVEVKSAQEKGSGEFFFQGIDPKKFDIIVLVFIGKDGTFMQIGSARSFGEWIKLYSTWYTNKSAREGYGYRVHKKNDYRHDSMYGSEYFFDMQYDENIYKVIHNS